jgi:dienelactone hydrolase
VASTADRDPSRDITRLERTMIDPTRPTEVTERGEPRSCRLLPVEVRLPTVTSTGARPLLVVAHGLDGSPSSLRLLLDSWTRAGYVVAAPTFPVTPKDDDGSSRISESTEQARDLSFVITRLLAATGRVGDPLFGRIDRHRIGAAGMSLGGLAVYALVSNSCCRDPRVGAATLMAAVHRQIPGEHYEENRVPVMLVHGDADSGYHNSRDTYPELRAPKWFVTLHGARHAPPFEVPPGPEAPLVHATTTAFWDAYLKGDAQAPARIERAVASTAGRATIRRAATG